VNDTEFLGDLEAFARKGFEVPKGALATAKYVLQVLESSSIVE
jgi:hypothetical protein